jgi:hypothetical protein
MALLVKKIILIFYGLLFLIGLNSTKTLAHPMPNSVVKLFVLDNFIKGEANIPYFELENALGANRDSLVRTSFIKNYFLNHIKVSSLSDNWTIKIDSVVINSNNSATIGNYKELQVHFNLIPKLKKSLRNFTLGYDAVVHQVITHSVVVVLAQDWKNGVSEETNSINLGIISYNTVNGEIVPLKVHLNNGSRWKGFIAMFQMGMLHIKNGTDHMLFILTLLLPAYLRIQKRRWSDYGGFKQGSFKILRIVTAFTIGHSLTLIAGTFNFMGIPAQLVESLIAVSILISVFHCISPLFYNKEVFIAIGFGLIHGLAFSQTLQNLNLDSLNLAISVLGFNLGIEVMQLLIILIIIPWIILLSKTHYFNSIKNSLAVLVGIAALGWLVQRATNNDNLVSTMTFGILEYSLELVIGLAVLSLLIYSIDIKQKRK